MINITLDDWYTWVATFIWPLTRILAFIATAPVLGESSIPVRVKLGLGILLTIVVTPSIRPLPAVAPASFHGLWIIAQQFLVGAALGLTMQFVLAVVKTAGEFVGLQMGLSFATFFDPATHGNTAVLSRLFNLVTLLMLLALDAHLLMLAGLIQTFEVVPITLQPVGIDGFGALLQWSGQIINLGLVMSLPLITALLTMNLSMGILNRTAPQLSVFAVGFPLALLAGLLMLAIVLPQTMPFFERLTVMALEAVSDVALRFATQP